MLDLRLVCEDCRVKWFVPATRPLDRAPTDCAACGGRLVPLEHAGERGSAAPQDAGSGP